MLYFIEIIFYPSIYNIFCWVLALEAKLLLPPEIASVVGEEYITISGDLLKKILEEKICELEKIVIEAKQKIRIFESKYGMSLEEFEKKMEKGEFLDWQSHNDYIEWYFWQRVLDETNKKIEALKNATKKRIY